MGCNVNSQPNLYIIPACSLVQCFKILSLSDCVCVACSGSLINMFEGPVHTLTTNLPSPRPCLEVKKGAKMRMRKNEVITKIK